MSDKKFISRSNRKKIYARDGMICCYCLKQCIEYSVENWKNNPLDVVTLDHITSQWAIAQTCESDAEFRRAIACPKNLVCVCNGCNSSKKNTELYIWASKKNLDYSAILARIAERIAVNV